MDLDWDVKIASSFRETICANVLANFDCSLGTDTTLFEECLTKLAVHQKKV
jgi:hypothetical protein